MGKYVYVFVFYTEYVFYTEIYRNTNIRGAFYSKNGANLS